MGVSFQKKFPVIQQYGLNGGKQVFPAAELLRLKCAARTMGPL